MFEILVNNQTFTLWETVTIERSIDQNCGKFRFTASNRSPSDYPVKAGDYVQILVHGVARVTGFVDVVSASMDEGTHTVTIQGRDSTQDVIDSSVPDGAKETEGPISMSALCERVIRALGASIPVTTNITGLQNLGESEGISAGSGENCMSFLTSFARKRQVYIISDGNGGIIVFRPSRANTSATPLIHKRDMLNNNVLQYSASFTHQNRFNRYVARSQDNFGFDDDADYVGDGINIEGGVTDREIRTSRYIEIQTEEAMDEAVTQQRVNEEANLRRNRSVVYNCLVQGVRQESGTIWDFGQFVNVTDEFAGIDGLFLIRSVKIEQDLQGGTKTSLTLSPPDAYSVEGVVSPINQRIAQTGQILQNTAPSNATRFNR